MGLSETIVAAIIGALATMGTAIFQLVRNRAPESKPKKNRVRSATATIALTLGALFGGYFWAQWKSMGAREEIAALRADLKLAQHPDPAAPAADGAVAGAIDPQAAVPVAGVTAHAREPGVAESLAQLPPCRIEAAPDEVGPVSCTEKIAATIALCAAIPAAAHVTTVRVLARVPKSESPWLERDAGAAMLGSLRIGAGSESPVSADQRSVCLDVANTSVDDALAVRVIVEYAFGDPKAELTAAAPTAQL